MKNSIEQAESEIKELLDSNRTSYEIGKRSGISNQVIDRYRKGTNVIENMTLKTAKKLLELKIYWELKNKVQIILSFVLTTFKNSHIIKI